MLIWKLYSSLKSLGITTKKQLTRSAIGKPWTFSCTDVKHIRLKMRTAGDNQVEPSVGGVWRGRQMFYPHVCLSYTLWLHRRSVCFVLWDSGDDEEVRYRAMLIAICTLSLHVFTPHQTCPQVCNAPVFTRDREMSDGRVGSWPKEKLKKYVQTPLRLKKTPIFNFLSSCFDGQFWFAKLNCGTSG